MQERAAEAEIAALEGRAQKEAAQAQKVMADTAKTAAAIPTQNVETQDKAFDLAAKMLAAIGAAPVADPSP
jgi:hypothetical protein